MAMDSPLHLKQTEAFINENPSDIVLSRAPKEVTTAGGRKRGAPVALPAQTMRRVGSSLRGSVVVRTTEDGRQVVPTAILIGLPSVDIQRGDEFDLDGVPYEVVHVNRDPAWRVSAEVVAHGG